MWKNLLIILVIASIQQAYANEDDNKIVIEGNNKSIEISDIPLTQYDYDDLSIFNNNIQPEKDLLNLLDNPEVLMGLDDKTIALDFD